MPRCHVQLFPEGPGDAVQSVANPCFQQSGAPGTATCPNSQHEQPAFDGTQSYYNSGWLKNNEKFTVHLSSGTSPGTYRFMCLLHREDMAGKITVVSPAKTVMSPSAQFALGQKQLAAAEAPLAQPAALLAKGQPPIPHLTLPGAPDAVLARLRRQQHLRRDLDQFGPRTIHIPVGGSVAPGDFVGDHSDRTFNSNKSNDDIQQVAPDARRAYQCGRNRPRRAVPVSRRPRTAGRRAASTSSSSPLRPGTARDSTTPASSSTRSGRR